MKKRIKNLLVLGLAICFMAVTASSAQAISLQDQYYLSMLRPTLPKLAGATTYPARLRVDIAGVPPSVFTLPGKVGMDATITDEELLAILKSAVPAEKSYKDLQNPVNDKVLVSDLTAKINLNDEDIERVKNNLLSMLGVDKVAALLSGNLPSFGTSDGIGIIVGGGEIDLSLLPDSYSAFAQGAAINGVLISWEQFQLDQEKYRDIVLLSQAKERLRRYYSKVNQLIKDFISDHGAWTLAINSKDTQPIVNFLGVDGCTNTLTADIKLVKDDGSAGNIGGSYTGHFKLRMDADLTSFDKKYGWTWGQIGQGNPDPNGVIAAMGFPSPSVPQIPGAKSTWALATDEGTPSEMYSVVEADDYNVNLALPYGADRAFIEQQIPAEPLFLTDFTNQIHRTVILEVPPNPSTSGSWDLSVDYDDFNMTLFSHWIIHLKGAGTYEGDNTEKTDYDPDFAPYLKLTLVVDMLG